MAQGKLKVKAKIPTTKGQFKKKNKGSAVTRRGNAPIQPKKSKFQEASKLKKIITKEVNKALEQELREKALEGKTTLIKKKKTENENNN